jgi:uncharacterized membrane protein
MHAERCHITNKLLPVSELVKGSSLRPSIFSLVKHDYPAFESTSYISYAEYSNYRKKHLEDLLQEEIGELSKLEKDVLHSINEDELLSRTIKSDIDKPLLGLGDRLADRIAEFGGSWTFIVSFFSFLFGWMAINVFFLASRPFDPFPFILLNLILSCLAAIQAPIIMMSQNRKESKDRQRAEHDYKINLKAELEIRMLHEKMDHMMLQQNQRLLEIQQIQVDLMEDILSTIKTKNKQ